MPSLRIIGQGLAGTALGWASEFAGVEFHVVDRGHGTAASAVSGGLINPVTGQRFVKSWHVESLLPEAIAFYRRVESVLGVPLLQSLRGWRIFRDPREAERYAAKHASGELAPFDRGPLARDSYARWSAGAHGAAEFGDVWRLDVPRYLAASRARWLAAGKLTEGEVRADLSGCEVPSTVPTGAESPSASFAPPPITILCTGAALAGDARLPANSTVAHGEIAELDCADFPAATMLNSGHWFVPLETGRILGGASYRPNGRGSVEDGVVELARAAKTELRVPVKMTAVRSGVRLVAADKLPIAGWIDEARRVGVCAALGSKGSLFAPWLARQWIEHLTTGASFAPEVGVRRTANAKAESGAGSSE